MTFSMIAANVPIICVRWGFKPLNFILKKNFNNMQKDNLKNENPTDANNVLAPVLLSRDRRHSHFWIEDGELFESYHTIRGLRYRHRFAVNGLPDTDKCQPDMIKYIEAEYLS